MSGALSGRREGVVLGSTITGRKLAGKCGDLLRPFTLELRRQLAGILPEGTNVAAAVEALTRGSFRYS
ncbi:hypothetical protein EP837_03787 (plasmid) [Sphingobium sp. EP60837]|nr:hypothetical protein EP837_03787 [Sphingobium sp. EP60837]